MDQSPALRLELEAKWISSMKRTRKTDEKLLSTIVSAALARQGPADWTDSKPLTKRQISRFDRLWNGGIPIGTSLKDALGDAVEWDASHAP